MKTDITPMGEDPTTGIKMHAFRYKGDPNPIRKSSARWRRMSRRRCRGQSSNWIERQRMVAPPVMGALTPPVSGGFNSGLKMPQKLAASVMGMPRRDNSPRAGARGVRGALANTKRRLPGIAGALGG